jgi:hypothetical protein
MSQCWAAESGQLQLTLLLPFPAQPSFGSPLLVSWPLSKPHSKPSGSSLHCLVLNCRSTRHLRAPLTMPVWHHYVASARAHVTTLSPWPIQWWRCCKVWQGTQIQQHLMGGPGMMIVLCISAAACLTQPIQLPARSYAHTCRQKHHVPITLLARAHARREISGTYKIS